MTTTQPNRPTSIDVSSELLKNRVIWLDSEVRDENSNRICSQMIYLSKIDPTSDITLLINSPGGSITAGMAIYDTMKLVRPDVSTVAMGLAASMGQFLLSSGTPGKRFIAPHARVMMHQPSGGLGGTQTDVRINAELIKHMKETLANLTALQTGKTPEQIKKDGDRDRWFTAEEALEYGFVDFIAAENSY